MKEMNIPVGVSDFEEIRKNGYYYIDKSGLIGELLSRTGTKVTLITRPRRFGKTLGMSMLESFFDIRKDSRKLFEGLEIAKNQVLCDAWMNRYPTAFVSFRQVDGLDFTGAYDMLTWVVSELYKRHLYLLDSDKIDNTDKDIAKQLARGNASLKDTKGSLMLLTRMMQQHYGKPVILLIDEYDVPVAKANNNGYYNEMLDVMKGLMQALKDNQALRFAVVTGCLKIAKESIFTGTNNFVSDTITNSRLSEYFGFVQSEVDQLLKDADLTEQAENIKKWYDGYHFGDFDVYCPWDVMNYMLELQRDPKAKPKAHGMIAEKPNSIYQKGGYTKKDVEKNILSNPFKHFEDMRFLMRCKDVETVEVNPIIFRKLTREDWLHIVDVCDKSLEKYYMRFKK